MKTIIALLIGAISAAEFKLPSVTYDEKKVDSALSQWQSWAERAKEADMDDKQKTWVDIQHIAGTW